MPFQREDRYLVFKISDLDKYMQPGVKQYMTAIGTEIDAKRMVDGKPAFGCVVVESDWPEYEPTWAAIEKRMEK